MKRWTFPIFTLFKFGFGIAILGVLIWSCDIGLVLDEIGTIESSFLIPVVLLYGFTLFLLSLRWWFILTKMGYTIPIKTSFLAFNAGVLLSDISPGRIGEVSRPFFIRDVVPAGTGMASFIIDRYVDFIGKVILCGFALILLASLFSLEMMGLFLFIAVVPVIIMSLFWVYSIRSSALFMHPRLILLQGLFTDIHAGMKHLISPVRVIIITVVWTLGISVLQGLRLVMIAFVVGYQLPLIDITILQSLVSSLSLVPVTISGLGLVEGGLTAVFSSYSIPVAAGISIAVLDRVITVLVHMTLGIWYVIRG